jgi:hypothetical protein
MGCLEGSGVPVLYIGRTVPKGYNCIQLFRKTYMIYFMLCDSNIITTLQ